MLVKILKALWGAPTLEFHQGQCQQDGARRLMQKAVEKTVWNVATWMWPNEKVRLVLLGALVCTKLQHIHKWCKKKTTDSKKNAKEAGGVVTNVQLNVSLRSLSFCLDLIGPGLLPSCALQFSQVWQLTPWRPRQSECIQSLSKHPQWHCIILYYSVLFLFSER